MDIPLPDKKSTNESRGNKSSRKKAKNKKKASRLSETTPKHKKWDKRRDFQSRHKQQNYANSPYNNSSNQNRNLNPMYDNNSSNQNRNLNPMYDNNSSNQNRNLNPMYDNNSSNQNRNLNPMYDNNSSNQNRNLNPMYDNNSSSQNRNINPMYGASFSSPYRFPGMNPMCRPNMPSNFGPPNMNPMNMGSSPQINMGNSPQINMGSSPQMNLGSSPQMHYRASYGPMNPYNCASNYPNPIYRPEITQPLFQTPIMNYSTPPAIDNSLHNQSLPEIISTPQESSALPTLEDHLLPKSVPPLPLKDLSKDSIELPETKESPDKISKISDTEKNSELLKPDYSKSAEKLLESTNDTVEAKLENATDASISITAESQDKESLDTQIDDSPKPSPKKINLPCLGKAAAKKRLKAFSANQFMMKERPKLINKLITDDKDVFGENLDDKKENVKKKKKKEQKSVIEQIKDEETRIKEVLNLNCDILKSYGITLNNLPGIYNSLESLEKFEAKGKKLKEMMEMTKKQESETIHEKGEENSSPTNNREKKRKSRAEEETSKGRDKDKRSKSSRESKDHKDIIEDIKHNRSYSNSPEKRDKSSKHSKFLKDHKAITDDTHKRRSKSRSRSIEKKDRGSKHLKSSRESIDHKANMKKERSESRSKSIEKSKSSKSFKSSRESDDFETNIEDILKRTSRSRSRSIDKSSKHSKLSIETKYDKNTSGSRSSSIEKRDDSTRQSKSSKSHSNDSIASSPEKKDINPFPFLPKCFNDSTPSNSTKIYKGSLIQFTISKPSIAYCVDPDKYQNHYMTLNEVKNKNSEDVCSIITDFQGKYSAMEETYRRTNKRRSWYNENQCEIKVSSDYSADISFENEKMSKDAKFKIEDLAPSALDEEYEAFMSTLETKDDNDSPKMASPDFREESNIEKQENEFISEAETKTVKEVKALLESIGLTKKERKELKNLKKHLKREKKEKKKFKKVQKKQKKFEKKERKKLRKMEKSLQATDAKMESYSDNDEEESKITDDYDQPPPSNLVTIEPSVDEDPKTEDEEYDPKMEDEEYDPKTEDEEYDPKTEDEEYDPTNYDPNASGVYGDEESTFKSNDGEYPITDISYSPSDVDLADSFSPIKSSSSSQLYSPTAAFGSESPYSPSSPQSSTSGSPDDYDPFCETFLDSIPMPPSSDFEKGSVDKRSPESSSLENTPSPHPVAFKLIPTKQKVAKKIVALPGFSMEEEEEPTMLAKGDFNDIKLNKKVPSLEDGDSKKVDGRKASKICSKKDSPRSHSPSEKIRFRSPSRDDQSEKIRSRSPSRDDQSEKIIFRSPSRDDQSEKIRSCSPSRDSISEKIRSRSPSRDSISEKIRSRSPSRDGPSEKIRSRSPSREKSSKSEGNKSREKSRSRESRRKRSKEKNRRSSRSPSPSSKWKRIKSPSPKRSPDYRKKKSSSADYHSSSEKTSDQQSPSYERNTNVGKQSGEEFSSYSEDYPRKIDSITSVNFDWPSQKGEYPEERNNDLEDMSFSPEDSPRRLSLDERLKQEHGLEIEEENMQQQNYGEQMPYWGYEGFEQSAGKARVIRVGNVLQVLPQESPEKNNQPKIVQTGNVIQVVPTDGGEGTENEASKVTSLDIPLPEVESKKLTTPVTDPLLLISSLLTSSLTKKTLEENQSYSASLDSSTVSAGGPQPVPPPPASHFDLGSSGAAAISSLPNLDSQQQSILSAAVNAAKGIPSANLSQLLSVLNKEPEKEEDRIVEPPFDLVAFKQQRKERKERKRRERELRHKARREKAMRERVESSLNHNDASFVDDDDDNDEIIMKEAMTEVPEIDMLIPDYEVYNDDDDDVPDYPQNKPKKSVPPILPPPEKGILIGPSYRILNVSKEKSVSFADGVMPGEGSDFSSCGEEIHSPPPPTSSDKEEKKEKKKKRKKVKVRIIKQFLPANGRMDSPPPPPPISGQSEEIMKLYPGCTHYTLVAPGTFVIYTEPSINTGEQQLGVGQENSGGGQVTIPPGMLIHSSALARGFSSDQNGHFMGASMPPYPVF